MEILYHALDDHSLLHILLAKVDTVGGCDVEKLHANCRHTSEEYRTRSALQFGSQRSNCDKRTVSINLRRRGKTRVHNLRSRCENGGDTPGTCTVFAQPLELLIQPFQLLNVSIPGAGIAGQIFRDSELCGIDEDADENVCVLASSLSN